MEDGFGERPDAQDAFDSQRQLPIPDPKRDEATGHDWAVAAQEELEVDNRDGAASDDGDSGHKGR